MSTFKEIVDKISRLVTPNPSSDVINVVEKLVLNYRALLIRRDMERSRIFHDKLVQTIESVPILERPTIGTIAFKTFVSPPIPSMVRLKTGYAIRFLGLTTRLEKFSYVDPNALKIVTHSRYTYKDHMYTIMDNKIHVLLFDHTSNSGYMSIPFPADIRLEAIFENPTTLFDYTDGAGNRLYDEDHEFPLTEDLEQQITQSILSAEASVLNPMRINEVNTDPQ